MKIRTAGDAMLLVEFDRVVDPHVNQQVIDLGQRLRARRAAGILDVVPGYCSLGVHFDPLRTDLAALERAIEDEARKIDSAADIANRPVVEIPVTYGGDAGPDLEAVAQMAGMTSSEVIACHTSPTYRVYMLGFVPGFAYLGRVDRRIAAPRHRVPRDRVPAGSVGIAAEQTGVYPIDTPGGWQILGRTALRMFDPAREPASLLTPGDLVRFVPL
jgi:KipI family sensor histidine kinase inhibitor